MFFPVRRCLATFLLIVAATSSLAGELRMESTSRQTHLLELFTSEGCSSCPPAETEFSKWKSSPRLWSEVVPVAFHVDYWDRLGWPDRFASAIFTNRQRAYAASWRTGSIYTPELVLNGREWKGGELPIGPAQAGVLRASFDDKRSLTISYRGKEMPYEVYAATLGFDLVSEVRSGENSGRNLCHDFVVLGLQSMPLDQAEQSASMTLPSVRKGEKAIAVWITARGNTSPIQAVGGWLK